MSDKDHSEHEPDGPQDASGPERLTPSEIEELRRDKKESLDYIRRDEELNNHERAILDYINAYRAKHGREPTYTEICKHVGIESKATIARYIAALEERGVFEQPSRPLFSATQI